MKAQAISSSKRVNVLGSDLKREASCLNCSTFLKRLTHLSPPPIYNGQAETMAGTPAGFVIPNVSILEVGPVWGRDGNVQIGRRTPASLSVQRLAGRAAVFLWELWRELRTGFSPRRRS